MTTLAAMGYKPGMLRSLAIRNHSLITGLDIELDAGLSVITGETGAGKSIVLEALGLALGNRADARALREGAERLEVSAEFDLVATPAARAWLAERALEDEGHCVLRRVVTRDGRSRAWINGQAATLADLKAIGDLLVDMHAQHEHHALLSRATQQELLDEFGQHQPLARAVQEAFATWRACRDELATLSAGARERADRRDLLRYQLSELEDLGLAEGEVATLESQQRLLANAGEVGAQIDLLLTLCEGEERGGLLAQLRRAASMSGTLESLGARAGPVRELFDSAAIQVDEARRELTRLADAIDTDPERLAAVESRLGQAHQLARKHRVPAAELVALQAELSNEARGLEGSDARIGALESELAGHAAAWLTKAKSLTRARQSAAREITTRVGEQLAFLGMGACRFEVALHAQASQEPAAGGLESAEFLVATNPGASPAPLARVASGGELSRISLAIQVITASRATTPTVIFDEVDVGIGGATADAVGSLLQTLGARTQVLCVKHLPQVAARGAQHWRAAKHSRGRETSAGLELLDTGARVEEIARMLGGRTLTGKTREHAKEMLETAQAGAA
ncbi:MAG: DNA repair protein RecN [Gammaproteobacteria bacterium]